MRQMASDVLDAQTGGAGGEYSTPGTRSNVHRHADVRAPTGEDDDTLASTHQPLSGVVLCCTAIPPETRSALAETARPLGATHVLDLTAAVTHLLVGDWDTAKYAFVARARPDVRVLDPEFVAAVREQWMSGADHVDVAALERAHAYPALQGTRICVTGFGDAEERRRIEGRVRAAGGEYTGDLTREVTHLVAAKPEGAKYAAARQWKVHIVTLRWLEESLERGLVLEAARYDPLLPPEDIGLGAWIRPSATDTGAQKETVKRKSEDGNRSGPARKLRRTASAKFTSQNENIWGEIVGGGITKGEKPDAWGEERKMPETSAPPDRQAMQMPRRTVSTGSLASKASEAVRSEPSVAHTTGFFSGNTVYIHGFGERETAVLERHLRTHGATLTDASDFTKAYSLKLADDSLSSQDFLILVPHTQYPPTLPERLTSLKPAPSIASEFYIEACLHVRRRLPPATSPLYAPIPANLSNFSRLTICATGFADVELLHFSKAVKRFGAEYTGTLRKDVSVLLCREISSEDVDKMTVLERHKVERELEKREKVKFARAHGVPVLWSGWLWACAKAGGKVAWDGWEVGRRGCMANEARKGNDEDLKENPPNKLERTTKGHTRDTSVPAAPTETLTRSHITECPNNTFPAGREGNETKDSPLTAALSSLLAARSRTTSFRRGSHSASTDQSATTSFAVNLDGNTITGGRRRRTLLGRAPSTASLRSVGSVGSANTDGVGTPLSVEGPVMDTAGVGLAGGLMEGVRDHLGEGVGNDERNETEKEAQEPHLTQVAYQDVPAQEWRQKMEARMAGDGYAAAGKGKGDAEGDDGDGLDKGSRRRRIRDEVVRQGLGNEGNADGGEGRRVLRRRA